MKSLFHGPGQVLGKKNLDPELLYTYVSDFYIKLLKIAVAAQTLKKLFSRRNQLRKIKVYEQDFQSETRSNPPDFSDLHVLLLLDD